MGTLKVLQKHIYAFASPYHIMRLRQIKTDFRDGKDQSMATKKGLFDWQFRLDRLSDAGDPLVRLDEAEVAAELNAAVGG
jgi:hypothetical protein